MAKITAKDVSQSAANAITGLASSRDKLRLLIGSLHQRSDEIAEMQRARQKERDLKEMQDRFDAARNAMNTAPAQPEGEHDAPVQEVRPAEPIPETEQGRRAQWS